MTKRSFNQRSLVLLSSHEFSALYLRLLRTLTDSGVVGDPSRLEAAAAAISQWPAPVIGHQDLPFLGEMVQLEMLVTI